MGEERGEGKWKREGRGEKGLVRVGLSPPKVKFLVTSLLRSVSDGLLTEAGFPSNVKHATNARMYVTNAMNAADAVDATAKTQR